MAQAQDDPVERSDEDREFAAISDADIWSEARDRLKIASEAYSENRKRAKAALLFREGDQWDHDVITTASEDNPELTINLTDAYVRRVVNNIRQQRPRGKCHPVGDGADVEMAEVINGIGRHIEARSEAGVAYDVAADLAVTCGEGYFRIVAEFVDPKSFHKDLRILPIRNVFSVDMDPAAIMPSGADQTWCVISTKMKRQEYRRRFPDASNANWTDYDRDRSRLEWEDKEEIRLGEYFRIREITETLYSMRNAQGHEKTAFRGDFARNPQTGRPYAKDDLVRELAACGWMIQGERESARMRVEWFRLNGLVVIDRKVLPGQWIPVFRVDGNVSDIDGRIRRRGMVESMMDPQRMVNYGEVAKIKRLGIAPKAPWVAAEGQLDGHIEEWTDANIKPYAALIYKPTTIATAEGDVLLPPPERQMPPQIEAGFSEFVQGMRSNLLAVGGMPNEPGADPEGVVVSGRAIKRRQWLSDQSHFQYYDNLTQAIAQCWRVIVEWIPAYYSEDRMQRIIGDDSTPQMVPINRRQIDEQTGIARVHNDLSIGRYDVVMDTGPGYDSKREEGAETLLQMLAVPALSEIVSKIAPDLVFRSIDHPYMQELADRLMAQTPEGLEKITDSLSGRAKSIVQSLFSENQALQKQLQAAHQEIETKMSQAQLTATTKIHDTNVRSQTALAVEEIRAGGKLLDSRMGHVADAQQLDRQLMHDAALAAQPAQPAQSGQQQPNQQQPGAQ